MHDVAREYGHALYVVAREEDDVATYVNALTIVSDSFVRNPEYLLFLASPNIPMHQRVASLEAVFSSLLPQKLVSFLQLLCEKGRLECFEDARKLFLELFEASKNILNITVKSAVPLTDSEKERLKNKLETIYNCSLRMHYVTDATLIGGVAIETEDKIIDGSTRNRLQQVKEVIKYEYKA